jgi:hypothetical protein
MPRGDTRGGTVSRAQRGRTMKPRWDSLIRALLLVRIGQELGSDSRLARAVAETLDALAILISVSPR